MMEAYFELARRLVSAPLDERPSKGVLLYRTLVRLQHRQALLQIFGPVAARVGTACFERLVDHARTTRPPRDPNPSRWARSFAEALATRDDVDANTSAVADYLATRIELGMAPDLPWTNGLEPTARLCMFPCDPRLVLTHPEKLDESSRSVLALHRAPNGRVRVTALDLCAIAAWGIAAQETDERACLAVGISAADLVRGREHLRGAGGWRP